MAQQTRQNRGVPAAAVADPAPTADITGEAVLGDTWPGIQLYYSPVKYAPALGIHDFSKAMAIHITPDNWIDEFRTYFQRPT